MIGNSFGGGIMDRMVSQLLTEIDQVVINNATAAAAAASVPPFSNHSATAVAEIGRDGDKGQRNIISCLNIYIYIYSHD